jgi:hypothetical protein
MIRQFGPPPFISLGVLKSITNSTAVDFATGESPHREKPRAHGRQTQHTPTSSARDANVHEPVLDVTVHDCPSRAWAKLTTLSHSHFVPTPHTANVWTSGGVGDPGGISTGGGTGIGVGSAAMAGPPDNAAITRAPMRLMNRLLCICTFTPFETTIKHSCAAFSSGKHTYGLCRGSMQIGGQGLADWIWEDSLRRWDPGV